MTTRGVRRRRITAWRGVGDAPDKQTVKTAYVGHVQSSLGRDEFSASAWDRYQALCLTVRDELIRRWINTQQTYYQKDARRVYYLSMEYLMGRALRNALVNLGYGQPQAAAAIAAASRDAGDKAETAQLIRLGLKELSK